MRRATPDSKSDTTLPWHSPTLEAWSIVGMNHYRQNGLKLLFVAMSRGDVCIKAEGVDTTPLWQELEHKAKQYPRLGDRP